MRKKELSLNPLKDQQLLINEKPFVGNENKIQESQF
ncbi:hypothetical protein SAMN05192550_1894 [Flavobacterium glycines]|uniref:Uncharacterized protein n=1 Tax=Flavobacterium glycines TaxID=551990 RepID=A0A1G8SRQ9_9FLAO|nr:hypothetical protein SAMN05192550_1894 [Flavobacterium glycines]